MITISWKFSCPLRSSIILHIFHHTFTTMCKILLLNSTSCQISRRKIWPLFISRGGRGGQENPSSRIFNTNGKLHFDCKMHGYCEHTLLSLLGGINFFHYLKSAAARLSAFGVSRLVVGSSSAKMPQLRQNVSAKASLIMSDASTCTQFMANQFGRNVINPIFCP